VAPFPARCLGAAIIGLVRLGRTYLRAGAGSTLLKDIQKFEKTRKIMILEKNKG
jgi:hypothetical protein